MNEKNKALIIDKEGLIIARYYINYKIYIFIYHIYSTW